MGNLVIASFVAWLAMTGRISTWIALATTSGLPSKKPTVKK